MSYANDLEAIVKTRIAKDLKDHTVTIKHLDGLYRHYRCQKPGTWNQGFDIVTWPGSLVYTGDMGDYLFQRTDDMISFMSSACNDPQYAAEKCVAFCRDGIREFRTESIREALETALAESEDGMYTVWVYGERKEKRSISDLIKEIEGCDDEHSAMSKLYESGLYDGCDLPSCQEYTYRFIWCLNAIKWFCEKVA